MNEIGDQRDKAFSSQPLETEYVPVEETRTSAPVLSVSETAVDSEKQSGCSSLYNAFAGFLFPRLTPISSQTFILLSFFTAIPAVLYIMAFTKMGFGLSSYYYLSENYEQYAPYLSLGLASGAFLLYLFDFYHWTSPIGKLLRKMSIGILVIGICILTLFMAGDFPPGPICVFLVMTAWWMIMARLLFYNYVEPRVFVSWLSGPLFFVAILTLASWLAWAFWRDENEWSRIVSLAEAEQSGCEPNFDEYPNCQREDGDACFYVNAESLSLVFGNNCESICTQVYDDCSNSFIIWVGPFLVSLGFVFLSFFATFLRMGSSAEQETTKFAQIWLFLLFAMWVGASLSGAGAGVSTTLAALTLASFIAAAIFLAISFSRVERKEQMQKIRNELVEKYGDHFDVFRGLLVVTCTPVFIIFFCISILKQMIRNFTRWCTKESLQDVAVNGWLTIEAVRLLRELKSWSRTKVLTCAVYWGLAFMILNVIVAQFTLLFLSWLIEETSAMALGTVTVILVGIGLIMFLLPPVPGVPIYLTLGIVIIPTGRELLGLIGSIVYALGVSLCLKLLACTLQQKLIGGMLQNKVGVRQFCGVNSSLMRSMKLVLKQPGFGIDKVSILVGGPDWPTSVLCGIMGLDLIPVLIGTLPVIFLITPTVLTGSFTYMSSLMLEDGTLEFPWAGTVATVFAAITAFVQFGAMVAAAYYLEQTISSRQEELDAVPIDEEVKAKDEGDELIRTIFEEITQWDVLPVWTKTILSLSVITMIISCYLVQLFAAECFTEYQLTYTIDEHLNGDWKNLVKPLGVVANALFVSSLTMFCIFRSWARVRSKQIARINYADSNNTGFGDKIDGQNKMFDFLLTLPPVVNYLFPTYTE